MSAWFDCADETQRAEGLAAAATAVLSGELVVLPTDTVYGVGADAFSPAAVTRLLAAKGRGREHAAAGPGRHGPGRLRPGRGPRPGRAAADRRVLARRPDHRLPGSPDAELGPG